MKAYNFVLTLNQKETLLKALESISKRHPESKMAILASELKDCIKGQIERQWMCSKTPETTPGV